jgi:ACS family sodium-dependent inorganic phosphate cotransporter
MASADSERQPLVEAASLRDAVASRAPLDDDDDAAAAASSSSSSSSSSSRRLPVRVVMGMLMCSAWIVAYSDRTNISLAIIAMEADLGFDAAVDGQVFGAFFTGYFFTQILGGWSAARWGGKRVLAFAVAMWSIWTLLTPLAAQSSVLALIFCRIMLGLGEGLALPALHHVTAQWSPVHERARFVAGVTSGQHIGKAAALLCSPLVAVYWPAIFYIFAALGMVWLWLWLRCAASSPAEHPTISAEERRLITQSVGEGEGEGGGDGEGDGEGDAGGDGSAAAAGLVVPWGRICSEPAFIGAVLCHFGHK